MRTSALQFQLLVDFMERHGDLSKPTEGSQGRATNIQLWAELTQLLNADATGDTKTAERWRKEEGTDQTNDVPITIQQPLQDTGATVEDWFLPGTSTCPAAFPPLLVADRGQSEPFGITESVRGHNEVRVELQMERWAARGSSVRLRCLHDVPPHLLDKVVFLRHGTKIFQYIRDRKPPYRNFTTPGAVLNIALATENSIILQNLDFAASGSYSCEVSMDTPIYTKSSSEKQLTVFHPQKHQPRIDFPTRYLSFGETLRANCTTAPALPAPHITWFINGKKMDELITHSHKFRVPMNERNGRKLQKPFAEMSTSSPLVALTHASHVATRPPGCSLKDTQWAELQEQHELNAIHSASRHRGRKPRGRDLYVTVSELQLIATGRLEITCVATIPEFRSIEDKFADVRNDTVIVDVIRPSTYQQPSANLTAPESSTSRGLPTVNLHNLLWILLLYIPIAV